MSLLQRILRFTIAFLFFSSSAFAEIPQELQNIVFSGDMNARSSVDFRKNARNVVSVIPKGSEGLVLEARKLKGSGAYALKIRVTQVPDAQGKGKIAQSGDETWVYFSQRDPWLSFRDRLGTDVQDPEVNLLTLAKRDGEGLPADGTVASPTLPTKDEVLREQAPAPEPETPMKDPTQTEAGVVVPGLCESCITPTVATDPARKNVADLQTIKKGFEQVPRRETATPVTPAGPSETSSAVPANWANDPMISRYSESKEARDTISYALRNKSRHSTSYCYRFVKKALLGGNMIGSYPPGGKAKQAVSDLKRQGMVNLLDTPKYRDMIKSAADAPKGAVIVYSNDNSDKSFTVRPAMFK